MKLINIICHHPLGGLVAILILLPPFLPLWWFTDGKYLIANHKSKVKSQMTCKDCIHYDNKIQEKTGKVEYHLCTEDEPNWKFVKNIDKPCKQFERKENSWESVSK